MRKLIFALLSTNEAFMATLPGGLSGDRKGGVPDQLPFGVLTHEGPNPGMGRASQSMLRVWVHGPSEDYTLIDTSLKAARDALEAAAPFQHQGVWLNVVEWQGNSPDLHDTDRGTNTKYATFLLTGSGL